MKLVSWNVWNRNTDIAEFRKFIDERRVDAFAFQELTSDHIEVLRSIDGYELYVADDFIEGKQLTHLGIFTRLPVLAHGVVILNSDRKVSSSWVGRHNRWIECIDSHHLTVSSNGLTMTIVNVHLSCGVSPRHRRCELVRAIHELDQAERVVVCGDMNTFANPIYNWLIGWFYGFRIDDLFTHEISSLDRFACHRGMVRTPRKAVTFPRLKLHLDHIIVRGMDVSACHIEHESYGSDHIPVSVNLM